MEWGEAEGRVGDVGGDRSGICSSNNKRRSKLTLYCDIRSLEELTDFRLAKKKFLNILFGFDFLLWVLGLFGCYPSI